MRRILILRGGALGDFILTAPAIQSVRRAFPGARVHLVCRDAFAAFAKCAGLADECTSLDSALIAALHAPAHKVDGAVREWAERFELAVNFLHDPDRAYENGLRRAGVGRIFSVLPVVSGPLHASRHFLDPLVKGGLAAPAEEPFRLRLLPAPACSEALGSRLKPGFVALHPGSGSSRKNWPASRFAGLAGKIFSRTGRRPVFFFGEADMKICADLETASMRRCAEFVSGLELLELAYALAACRLYVGNDSGVTHLAAALGAPTIALFGPTAPEIWGPAGQDVEIISSSSRRMDDIALSRVWKAAARHLELSI